MPQWSRQSATTPTRIQDLVHFVYQCQILTRGWVEKPDAKSSKRLIK